MSAWQVMHTKNVCKYLRKLLVHLRASHDTYRWLHGRRKTFLLIFRESYSKIARVHFGLSKKAFCWSQRGIVFDSYIIFYVSAWKVMHTKHVCKHLRKRLVQLRASHDTYKWLYDRKKTFLSIFWKSYSEIAKNFGTFLDQHFSLRFSNSAASAKKVYKI